MLLTVMLIGGLSMTSMQEIKAAEIKEIDGSKLTHDEESIGYDTKITRTPMQFFWHLITTAKEKP